MTDAGFPDPPDLEEGRLDRLLKEAGPPRAPDFLDRVMSARPEPAPVEYAAGRRVLAVRRLWPAAAAAALLLGLFALYFAGPGGKGDPPRALPAGRPVTGVDERFRTDERTREVVELPDGSRLRIGSDTQAGFQPPRPGERIRLALTRGSVEAEVNKGSGEVRIVSDAGEIVVVGTAFSARALRIHAPLKGGKASFETIPVLAVDVRGGAVDLRGPARTLRVTALRRGLLWGSDATLQESADRPWTEAAKLWGSGWKSSDFPRSAACVSLLAWTEPSSWSEALAATGGDPEARRVAATLAALSAEEDSADSLIALYAGEPDLEVRRVLRPHIERILGMEKAAELLDKKKTGQ